MNSNYLRELGLKCTKNRKVILEYLEAAPLPLTADDIYIGVRGESDLNLSTVYRTLLVFLEKGILEKNIGVEGMSYYSIKRNEHSHFLVCSTCRKRVIMDDCPLKDIENKVIQQTGFHITGHSLEFFGECKECSENKRS